MAYTNPLDPATPADTDPVAQGDDRMRELKAAIIERLETLVEDVDADPLVPLGSVFGKVYRATLNATLGEFALFTPVEKTLMLRVVGDTDASGELTVDLADMTSSGVVFNLAYLVGVFAEPEAPEYRAATPNSPVVLDIGGGEVTLRVANESVHAVAWNLLLFFSE